MQIETKVYSISVARLPGEIEPERCAIEVRIFFSSSSFDRLLLLPLVQTSRLLDQVEEIESVALDGKDLWYTQSWSRNPRRRWWWYWWCTVLLTFGTDQRRAIERYGYARALSQCSDRPFAIGSIVDEENSRTAAAFSRPMNEMTARCSDVMTSCSSSFLMTKIINAIEPRISIEFYFSNSISHRILTREREKGRGKNRANTRRDPIRGRKEATQIRKNYL